MNATAQRILIVDDNPEDRATFRRYLTQGLRRGDEVRIPWKGSGAGAGFGCT